MYRGVSSEKGGLLVTGGTDGDCKLWDQEKNTNGVTLRPKSFTKHRDGERCREIFDVKLGGNLGLAVSLADDRVCRVWRTDNGK